MRATILAAAVFALGAATATAADAAPIPVYRVDTVVATIMSKHLIVSASGAVRSGGWKRPRLHLKEIHTPESDTEVIEFLATPPAPGEVVIQALLPVTAAATFPLPRYGSVQVKVIAESNAVTAPIAPLRVVQPAIPKPSR